MRRPPLSALMAPLRENRRHWMQLAELSASEQDPEKLSERVREIDRLLAEKMERLERARGPSEPSEQNIL
jgi:hypothetical protein